MSKTSRVAELAVKLARTVDVLPNQILGAPLIAADAAALVRLADTVTACDTVECNGGAVDGDDYAARRVPSSMGPMHTAAWTSLGTEREARVTAADKRRTRALAKAAKLAGGYGLSVWHQPDPRGASLYLYDPAKHGEPHAGWDQHAPGVVCV